MPAGTALTVFTLAEKLNLRIEYLLWEMPLCLLYQAVHYVLFCGNANLRRVQPFERDDRAEIARMIGLLP